jgi:retron-type reverse transcriptase
MNTEIMLSDVYYIYRTEISKTVKNKRKLYFFEKHLMSNLSSVLTDLKNPNYKVSKCNIFLVKEPKKRVVMSLNLHDKLINHVFTRLILNPKLEKYLDNRNVATRKGKGLDYAIKKIKYYLEKNKKYDEFYILKLDIKKYFYNISHQILLKKLERILNYSEYNYMSKILEASNEEYVNREIKRLTKEDDDIPLYKKNFGLQLGFLSSQTLAIFYLEELDHYIINTLHLTNYIRYNDDFLIIYHDKEYLKKCQKIIIEKLENEYLLSVNENKTEIINVKNGFNFLGYNFKVINKKTIVNISNSSLKKVKKNIIRLKNDNDPNFNKYFSSVSNYMHSFKYANNIKIINLLKRYNMY